MAMGKRRRRATQASMWVATQDLPRSAAHPFYRRLSQILDEAHFDEDVETRCQRFYADELGRPGLLPGRYFRLLLLGYFEGLDSERGIVWRAADSLSGRSFLGLELHEAPPDHSTISRTRRLIEALLHEDPAGGPALLGTLRRSHTTGMKSKVHPTYKTKYRVANWAAYNQALVRRGDVTVWVSSEAIAAWTPGRSGRRGGQRRYSDLAIETALTLRLLYHLPLRQAEGFLHALFGMMRLDLSAPDSTTLSRRSQHWRRRLRPVPPGEGLHLVLDSTGLSIVGAGEWAAAKHGGRGRRGWRKLHLGVDQSGVIRVHTLTEETGDDAITALDLLTAVDGPLVRVTADAASDTVTVYETAGARGATVVIPPAKTANVSGHGPRSPARDRAITLVKQLGRRQWKKTSGYHRQGRVENTFFRYKSIIGDGLRARSPAGQGSEVVLGCEILNRMTALGRPVSYRIGR